MTAARIYTASESRPAQRQLSFIVASWPGAFHPADAARSRGKSRPLQNRLQPYRQPGIALSPGPGLPKCALKVPVWRAGSVQLAIGKTRPWPGPDIWNEVQNRFQFNSGIGCQHPRCVFIHAYRDHQESVAARVMIHPARYRPRCLLDAEAAPTLQPMVIFWGLAGSPISRCKAAEPNSSLGNGRGRVRTPPATLDQPETFTTGTSDIADSISPDSSRWLHGFPGISCPLLFRYS